MDLRDLFGNPEDGKVFKAGTTIFTEGTPGDVMYVVLDGEVEVSVGGKVIEVMKPEIFSGKWRSSILAREALQLWPNLIVAWRPLMRSAL